MVSISGIASECCMIGTCRWLLFAAQASSHTNFHNNAEL